MLFKSLGSIVNQSQSSSANYSSSEDNYSNTNNFSSSPVPSSSPLSSSYGSNHTAHTTRSTATPMAVFSRPYWSGPNGF